MSSVELHVHSIFQNFTIVSNEIINSDLSLESKMILIWFLSKPPSWQLNTKSIATIHNIGKNKVTSISKELQDTGYLSIQKMKTGKTVWHVFDQPVNPIPKPCPQNRDEGSPNSTNRPVDPIPKPRPQKPDLANGDVLVRTDSLVRTDNIKPLCVSFEEFWKIYPKKTDRKYCEAKWKRLKVTPELFEKIKNHLSLAYKEIELQYIPHAKTYLSGEKWNDQIIVRSPKEKTKSYNLPFDGSALDRFARKNGLPAPKGGEASDSYRARLIGVMKKRDNEQSNG